MPVNIATYNPQVTPVHAIDARVKIILVLAYSVALFCVHTWWGIGLLATAAIITAALARLDVVQTCHTFLPLYPILLITLVIQSFSIGSGFLLEGFARGLYYVVRIVLLLAASLVLTTTSSSTEITAALRSFLRPLEKLGFPSHDVATIVSIALRFIPVTLDEFHQVRAAQTARGAHFNSGTLVQRVRAWVFVLIPIFIGLYRRADVLAEALNVRCYGTMNPTQLARPGAFMRQLPVFVCGLATLIVVAVFG